MKDNAEIAKHNNLLTEQYKKFESDAIIRENFLMKKFTLLLNEKKKMLRESHNLSKENIDQMINQINCLTIKSSPQSTIESTMGSFNPNSSSLFAPSQNFRPQTKHEIEHQNQENRQMQAEIPLEGNDRNLTIIYGEQMQNEIKLEETDKKKRNSYLDGHVIPKVETSVSDVKRKELLNIRDKQKECITIIGDDEDDNQQQYKIQTLQTPIGLQQKIKKEEKILENSFTSGYFKQPNNQPISLSTILTLNQVKTQEKTIKPKQKKDQMVDENDEENSNSDYVNDDDDDNGDSCDDFFDI